MLILTGIESLETLSECVKNASLLRAGHLAHKTREETLKGDHKKMAEGKGEYEC